jgi:hypothetical protein
MRGRKKLVLEKVAVTLDVNKTGTPPKTIKKFPSINVKLEKNSMFIATFT